MSAPSIRQTGYAGRRFEADVIGSESNRVLVASIFHGFSAIARFSGLCAELP